MRHVSIFSLLLISEGAKPTGAVILEFKNYRDYMYFSVSELMQIQARSKNAETITTLILYCFALNSCQRDFVF